MPKTSELWEFSTVVVSSNFYPPAAFATDAHWSSDPTKRLQATKVVHQFGVPLEVFGPTTTISGITKLLHIVRGATGVVVGLEGCHFVAATGADRTVTVDLQKSTGGGAFATILSTPLTWNTNSTAVRTAQAATISSANLVDGDILQAVITVAGSAGAQAQGLLLTLQLREDPTI